MIQIADHPLSLPKRLTDFLPDAISKSVGLAASSLCALLMLAIMPAQAQSATLRLMPIGDSITAGYLSSDNNGYRKTLYTDRQGAGDQVDFVGSLRDGNAFDPDHEGHSGKRIDEVATYLTTALPNYQPNIVTLHIGTNDMLQDYELSTAPTRLGSMIDQIISALPGVTVVVAQLIPNTGVVASSGVTIQSRVDAYNSAIPGVVQTRVNAGKHVYMVSMSTLTASDLSDGTHPNDGGYQKMASVWNASIAQVISKGWVTNIPFAGRFEIVNVASGQSVDVQNKSTANDAPVVQMPNSGGSSQLWNFIPTSSGYYQIFNCLSAKDIVIYGASTGNNAKAVQDPYGTTGNDQWQPVKQADGSYVFYNRHSGLVLDNPGGGSTQGTQFIQYTANGGSNQKFTVTAK